jgi:hypothetical protein
MQRIAFVSLLALASLLTHVDAASSAAQRQAPGAEAPGRTVTRRPEAKQAPAPSEAQGSEAQERGASQDKDEQARQAKETAKLRAAFGEEFYSRKQAASAELAAARERAGDDDTAFAAARTEIARKYRGELATLRTSYAEKARALGVTFSLPGDDTGLEQAAAAAAPAAALRMEFTAQVAALARAAQKELAVAQETAGKDANAFAAQRTEIARRYRGQVLGLQQSIARRAAEQSVTVDTSDVAKVMDALAAAETAAASQPRTPPAGKPVDPNAPPKPAERAPADANTPKPGADPVPPPAPPAARPIDAEVLRTAFTKQVDTLRTSLASELATADATLKGDELAAKRSAIVQKHRSDLASYRANVAARAQAAGVTLTLPTDQELVPELGPVPPAPPKDGQQPPKPEAPKQGDGAAPPKDAPPQPATGGKRGSGPRFGNGGGGS